MGGKEKGLLCKAKGEREKSGAHFGHRISLGNETARTHARMDETKRNERKRNETISWLDPLPPNLRFCH